MTDATRVTDFYKVSLAPCSPLSLWRSLTGGRSPFKRIPLNPSYLSYPSSVRGSDVIAPVPPVTEALAEDTLVVGDWVWLLSADGVQQNVTPYQIRAIARGPDERCYARFAETPTGWPLAQCARADPSATVRPPPCAVCGGTERWDDAGILRCVTCWPWRGAGQTRGQTWLRLPQGPRKETDDVNDRQGAATAQPVMVPLFLPPPCLLCSCAAGRGCRHLVPATPAWSMGSQAKHGCWGIGCVCLHGFARAGRTLKVEGALAAPRWAGTTKPWTPARMACYPVRRAVWWSPTDRARDRPPYLEDIVHRLWPFFAVALEAKGGCDDKEHAAKRATAG